MADEKPESIALSAVVSNAGVGGVVDAVVL